MEGYLIHHKKEFYYKILKIFEHDNYVASRKETEDPDSLTDFIEKFKVIQFFISLIAAFDPQKHLSCSVLSFREYINQWNKTNPEKKVDEKILIDKYYVLEANNRVILNPEIKLIHNKNQLNKDLEFLFRLEKNIFEYPLFKRDTWESVLSEHNKKIANDLTINDLLGENKDLHSALFHNHKHLQDAFGQAFQLYLTSIEFKTWEENIEYYFYLLLEINHAEIPVDRVINNLDKSKRNCLIHYAINRLYKEKDIFKIEDLNYLLRLKYVPHEIKGENIYQPGESSKLIAYDKRKNQNDIANCFEKLDRADHYYENFEFRHYYQNLFAEVVFTFQCFQELIAPEEWRKILETVNSSVYQYYFSIFVYLKPKYITKFDSIKLAPVIIQNIFSLRGDYYFRDQTLINIELLKEELLKDFILWVDDGSEDYLNLLLDLYFYLPSKESPFRTEDYPLKYKIRKFTIDKIVNYLDTHHVSDNFYARFTESQDKEDFAVYDLLIAYSRRKTGVQREIAEIIVQAYLELFNEDKIISTFFGLNGFENLMESFSLLNDSEISALKIDFKESYSNLKDSEPLDWGKYVSLSRKLRFHIGILAKFLVETNQNNKITEPVSDYLLDSFQYFKIYSLNGHSPLSWDEALQDTFSIFENKAFDNGQLLVFLVSKILDKKGQIYINEYIQAIKNKMSFSEAVIFTQNLHIPVDLDFENLFPTDFKGTGLGRAEREAAFLVGAGYTEKALKYIDYLKQISQEYQGLADRKLYWAALELQALLHKDLDKALKLIESLPDEGEIIAWKGLTYYLIRDFPKADLFFKRYLKDNKPSLQAIVNYSAVLIETQNHSQAINWCEQYIDQYPDDYLLNANLACAYSNTDRVKSLYYYYIAANLNPDYPPSMQGVLQNIKELVDGLPEMLANVKSYQEARELKNNFIERLHSTAKKIANVSIPDIEIKIVKTIHKAIELLSEKPVNLQKLSENELSDQIYINLSMSPVNQEGIEIAREAPQGHADIRSGELDFFLYRTGENYENIATGENKEWSPGAFENQLKQLLGYLRVEAGFGFTIIFNKSTRLQTVLDQRKRILENFFINDNDNKLFEKEGPIIEMVDYSEELRKVILTCHKNPEIDNSLVRIYHFVVNSYDPERICAGKLARQKR